MSFFIQSLPIQGVYQNASPDRLLSYYDFIHAVEGGNIEEVKKALQDGVDVNSTTLIHDYALLVAARNNDTPMVKLLLDKTHKSMYVTKMATLPLHSQLSKITKKLFSFSLQKRPISIIRQISTLSN